MLSHLGASGVVGGVCPGHNESGGKRRSGHTRHGDQWLTDALMEAAWAAARSKDTLPGCQVPQSRRLQARRWTPQESRRDRGPQDPHAAYAIMVTPDEVYRDLGADWFPRHHNPDRRKQRLVRQLESMGFTVDLTPATA